MTHHTATTRPAPMHTAPREDHAQQLMHDLAEIASHDLQEPLRKIQAFSSRLETIYADRPDREAEFFVEKMSGAALRVRTLLDDVLTVLDTFVSEVDAAPVHLGSTTRECVGRVSDQLDAIGARVTVHPKEAPFTVEGNRSQLVAVIDELLANAIKFRNPSVPLSISIALATTESEDGTETVTITVADNGIGFGQHQAERIFSMFRKLHPSDAYAGTGIGLAICSRIVLNHNGTIVATGEEGNGATFTVELPTTLPEGRDSR